MLRKGQYVLLPGEPLSLPDAIAPPDLQDIRETMSLFADFALPLAVIPRFPTRNALILWRTRRIKALLDGKCTVAPSRPQSPCRQVFS